MRGVSTVQHRRVFQNESFRAEVRYVDDTTGVPWTMTGARMRGVMPLTDGVYDKDNGVDAELFEVVPTQAMPGGWITGFVAQATIALCPVGVGRWDMALEFAGDRMRAVGGTLEVREGVSQW